MNNNFRNKIIGVLMGGLSKEREISLKSGNAILEALLFKGYDAVPIDVGKDISKVMEKKEIEVAFLALHGRYGEDGCIQGLLEIHGIPYTGSSVMASGLAMDKYLTKDVARAEGIPTPEAYFFDSFHERFEDFNHGMGKDYPYIVKPSREGSTIGIRKIVGPQELREAVVEASQLDSRVLVEKFISGRELTVSILNGEALPVLEVAPKSGFYDFQSKYTPGATDYFCPAKIPAAVAQALQSQTVRLFRRMGCEGAARADFILSDDEKTYFLEINTLPGMTTTSLVPKAAAAAGLSFGDLVEKILFSARLKVQ